MNKIGIKADIPESTLALDLENWMGNLPLELKVIPIILLSIPGSHNSMTYTITSKSKVAPDAYDYLKQFHWLGRPLQSVVSHWCITQSEDITSQLKHGIRYLDLRLTTKPNSEDIFICHALYGANVRNCFLDVNQFLNEHTGEVVILDLQHFYAFQIVDHKRLNTMLIDIFGDKLLTHVGVHVNHITLNDLINGDIKHQVIIIYRSPEFEQLYWPGYLYPTPWPDTVSSADLFRKLDVALTERILTRGYVTQCILTPDTNFILRNFFSNLRTACGIRLHMPMLYWLSGKSPGAGHLNVSICDFVDLDNWSYSRLVIDLNKKLIPNQKQDKCLKKSNFQINKMKMSVNKSVIIINTNNSQLDQCHLTRFI